MSIFDTSWKIYMLNLQKWRWMEDPYEVSLLNNQYFMESKAGFFLTVAFPGEVDLRSLLLESWLVFR